MKKSLVQAHKNIFFAYRAPRNEGTRANEQIEDNLTRAFVITVEGKNSEIKNNLFLLLIDPEGKNRILKDLGDLVEVRLQAEAKNSKGRSRRLDAKFIFANGVVIGLESKVEAKIELESKPGDEINLGQIIGELTSLERECGDKVFLILLAKKSSIEEKEEQLNRIKKLIPISWEDVHKNIEKYLKSKKKQDRYKVDLFLVEQFKEYLELNGMVERFFENDFERAYLGDFKNSRTKLDYMMANIFMDNKGFKLSKKAKKSGEQVVWTSYTEYEGNLNDHPHFTAHMDADGIEFMLTVEGRETPRQLSHIMSENEAFSRFCELIKKLERGSSEWPPRDQILFSLLYNSSFFYRQRSSEPTYETIVPLIIRQMKNGRFDDEQKHKKNENLRKNEINRIFKELAEKDRYRYFRIRLHVPKNCITNKESIQEQIQIIKGNSEELFEIYNFWKEYGL